MHNLAYMDVKSCNTVFFACKAKHEFKIACLFNILTNENPVAFSTGHYRDRDKILHKKGVNPPYLFFEVLGYPLPK